jgi:predicted CopG family antitoxin
MAVKTITIDLPAYTLLARRKDEGQSFSDVIKAHFGAQPTTKAFLANARKARVSDDAIDAMERQVQARPLDPARAVTL